MEKVIGKDILKEHDHEIGMLIGLAIGDAMGAPIEFEKPRSPENYVREYQTGGFHNVTKGEFTDDTSMALAMADAFIEKGTNSGTSFDGHLIMKNFLNWRYEGKYSPRGVCFDVGLTVAGALSKYRADDTNPFTGETDPMSAGNGGLMRLAPAIIAAHSKEEAIFFARESTRLTHGCEEALMYSEILAEELWEKRTNERGDRFKLPSDTDRSKVLSGGYVKETYQAAWWAYQTSGSFEECVVKAINRGHDSDTTGAVAGMIAGAMYGFSKIPDWMINGLQWKGHIIMTALQLKLGKGGTYRFLRKHLFSQKAKRGDTASIFGKKAYCLDEMANYGGGSAQLWAIEGLEAQITEKNSLLGYKKIRCLEIEKNYDLLVYENDKGASCRIPLSSIARYDAHHLN